MTIAVDTAALTCHQERALGVLARGVACLEEGPERLLADHAGLRVEIADVLGAYQRFKHERVFDPAIASGDEQRVVLARHMKVGCIAAGEVYRVHMAKWDRAAILADWPRYKVAARLTVNQLRRHVVAEGEGIAELIEVYGHPTEPGAAHGHAGPALR